MVIWIIGMYASGKSTLANELKKAVVERFGVEVLVLSGGELRKILGDDLKYTLVDRRRNAERISRLCKYLSEQGVVVICSMLSLFEETRTWNRANFDKYFEIFLDVSMENLLRRDRSNLYRRALAGLAEDVVGVDIEFLPPRSSDLCIDNNSDRESLADLASYCVSRLTMKYSPR